MKKRIFCLILAILMILLSTAAFATEAIPETGKHTLSEPYEYRIVPGMEEWAEYDTLERKINACHVPDQLLESMTTEALVDTVLNYPLLINMFAFNTLDAGVRSVASYFGGIEELLARDDAVDKLRAYSASVDEQIRATDVKRICADALLRYIAENDMNSVQASVTSVRTPAGSSVSAVKDATWAYWGASEEETEALSQSYLSVFTSARIISGVNPAYNCHSYAWYSQSTSNRYWINDPTRYMTDGSYSEGTVSVGSKVFYDSDDSSWWHSAVVSSLPTSGNPTVVVSKWGMCALYSHNINDCPYTTWGSISVVSCWA